MIPRTLEVAFRQLEFSQLAISETLEREAVLGRIMPLRCNYTPDIDRGPYALLQC